MNRKLKSLGLAILAVVGLAWGSSPSLAAPLNVVVTSSSYAPIARYIGGEHVKVNHLVEGYQDPHIVRPKPSLAVLLAQADLLVATGLDLEMWAPALVDQANNPALRSGGKGYVSASAGVPLGEVPATLSRSEGDVHLYGNPHIHTSPLNGKTIAENITVGLKRVDPANASLYDANLARFKRELDHRLYGAELVDILGAKTLDKLARSGRLIGFLQSQEYKGKPLYDYLGGWMKQAEPLRGQRLVTFHKNWGYFTDLFGIEVVGYMEPKPGLPPSPGHITRLVQAMKDKEVRVILAANYFDEAKVRLTAERAEATPVVMGLAVGGEPGMDTVFDQFDMWIAALLGAFEQAGVTN